MSKIAGTWADEAEEKANQDATEDWQQGVNEQFEEEMAKRGEQMPAMEVLLKDAERIDEAAKHQIQTVSHERGDSGGTDALEQEILDLGRTPTAPSSKRFDKKPHYTAIASQTPSGADDQYQESFTSQQETAELREEMSTITSRLSNMEATLEIVLKERDNLPSHLERITQDINRQFTMINERLNASIESGLTTASAQQAAERLQEMAVGTSTVLNIVKTDLENPPSKMSQASQSRVITGKKKKIQLFD